MDGMLEESPGSSKDSKREAGDNSLKKKYEELKAKYESLFDSSPYAVVTFDLSGYVTSCNKSAAAFTGKPAEEIVGLHYSQAGVMDEEQTRNFERLFKGLTAGKSYAAVEITLRGPDGSTRRLETFPRLIVYEGVPGGVQITAHDVTKKKDAELRRTLMNTKLIKLAKDPLLHDGNFNEALNLLTESAAESLSVFAVCVCLFGEFKKELKIYDFYNAEEGSHTAGAVIPFTDDPDFRLELLTRRVYTKNRGDSEIRSINPIAAYFPTCGKHAFMTSQIIYKGDVAGFVYFEKSTDYWKWTYEEENFAGSIADYIAIAKESAERRSWEERLQFQSDILNMISDHILVTDPNGIITYVNETEKRTLQKPEREIIGESVFSLGDNKQKGATQEEILEKTVKNGSWRGEVVNRAGTGEEIIFDCRTQLMLDEKGAPKALVGISTDVTEQKKAEEKLRSSEEKFRAFINSTTDMAFLKDDRFLHILANKAYQGFLGKEHEEIVGKSDFELLPKELAEGCRETDLRALKAGHTITFEETFGEKSFMSNKFPVVLGTGKIGVGGLIRDITEQKRAEEIKRRAEAMESLGALAGGVAHDLNNILGPLVGYPELLLMKLPEDSPLREDILQIKQAASRAADEVQDLLTLSRRAHYLMSPLNINTMIKNLINCPEFNKLKEESSEIRLEVNPSDNLLPVKGSENHLSKALMNLVINAYDAMPEGGTLKISTRNLYVEKVEEEKGPALEMDKGEYIEIVVEDNGAGIPDEFIHKIFEPFFSKKKLGRRSGSGLGLAVVNGVISDHHGYITVKSRINEGTSFRILLPAIRDNIVSPLHPPSDLKGQGTILIVDDDEGQRNIMEKLLNSLGYDVSSVSNGYSALEYLEENDPDIVILDMIMPDMDGLDTFKEIRKKAPNQKTVIASGFSQSRRVREAQKLGAGEFIKKPMTLESLGTVVSNALSKKNRA